MTPKEQLMQYSLTKGYYLKTLQLLKFCKARLKNMSVEKSNTVFNYLLYFRPGNYGLSFLYEFLRKKLARGGHENMFQPWGTLLDDPELPRKILEGMQSLRKHVICETWRETLFKIGHRALYGFNLPNPKKDPSRIRACPKCGQQLTDLWHGLWLCLAIQSF